MMTGRTVQKMRVRKSIRECGFNPKLIRALNQATDVVTKDFTKHFISLCDWKFRSDEPAKLGFYHAKGRFDVRPLVVVSHEVCAVQIIVVKHAIPDFALALISRVAFEINVRDCAFIIYQSHVGKARISLICADFLHIESLRSLIYERCKVVVICAMRPADFSRRYNIGFDSAHNMGFDPFALACFFPVLFVIPSVILRSRKTRRINREVSLYRLERQRRLNYQPLQIGREFFFFEIAIHGVVAWEFRDIATRISIFQIGHELSGRNRFINLEHSGEKHVRHRQASTAPRLYRLINVRAEGMEQFKETGLFVHLSGVVGFPHLFVSQFDSLGDSGCSDFAIVRFLRGRSRFSLTLNRVFNRVDVLAVNAPQLEIGACAGRPIGVGIINLILCTIASLRQASKTAQTFWLAHLLFGWFYFLVTFWAKPAHAASSSEVGRARRESL